MHDGSFNELHHRVTTVLKLRVTPQTKGSCQRVREREKNTEREETQEQGEREEDRAKKRNSVRKTEKEKA